MLMFRIGPRFRKGWELRLRVHDALDDAEQVEGAARQLVESPSIQPRIRPPVYPGREPLAKPVLALI
jgi:hypothetical protein